MRKGSIDGWNEEYDWYEMEGDEDDGDGAFWDEFFGLYEATEMELEGKGDYTIKLVDEETGEESVFERVKIVQDRVIRG